MLKQNLNIKHIPAILWGEPTNNLMLAVHGNKSNKQDDNMAVFAECAVGKGYQVLSFDLPDHGERQNQNTPLKVQNGMQDLVIVMEYAKELAENLSLFGCSIGAYLSLMTYKDVPFKQALFLSPVVDMQRLIRNMMTWFQVSEEQLKTEKEIATPIGQTLYWDYYCYVMEHPVTVWDTPTAVLYGVHDDTCEMDTIVAFVERFHGELTIMEEGEHYFHTEEQLSFFRKWCINTIKTIR